MPWCLYGLIQERLTESQRSARIRLDRCICRNVVQNVKVFIAELADNVIAEHACTYKDFLMFSLQHGFIRTL